MGGKLPGTWLWCNDVEIPCLNHQEIHSWRPQKGQPSSRLEEHNTGKRREGGKNIMVQNLSQDWEYPWLVKNQFSRMSLHPYLWAYREGQTLILCTGKCICNICICFFSQACKTNIWINPTKLFFLSEVVGQRRYLVKIMIIDLHPCIEGDHRITSQSWESIVSSLMAPNSTFWQSSPGNSKKISAQNHPPTNTNINKKSPTPQTQNLTFLPRCEVLQSVIFNKSAFESPLSDRSHQ